MVHCYSGGFQEKSYAGESDGVTIEMQEEIINISRILYTFLADLSTFKFIYRYKLATPAPGGSFLLHPVVLT